MGFLDYISTYIISTSIISGIIIIISTINVIITIITTGIQITNSYNTSRNITCLLYTSDAADE